jgi:CRISPR-associated protein Cmr2
MPMDWDDLLLAYLHDPPDKALDIRGHLFQAEQCASVAIGRQVDRGEFKKWEDQLASAYERLPTPNPGGGHQWAVGPEDGRLVVRHPLSGQERHLDIGDSRISVASTIEDLVAGRDDPRHRFLILWRMLPERLGAPFNQLPADTRTPDHTIWHHLDITAGLTAAGNDRAFLSFHLGPVQSFIAAARTVRDLWTGSAILSWLTFQAMLPIIEELGPTAMVFPALRGSPLMDLWLHKNKCLPEGKTQEPAPCLPNRFLALVPGGKGGGQALDLARRCEDEAREGWLRLADRVRKKVNASLQPLCHDWDRRWDEQIGSFFEFRTAVCPWGEATEQEMAALLADQGKTLTDAFPDAGKVRSLADTIPRADRPGYQQNQAGLWQARVELAGRIMEAQRSVRHVPAVPVATPVPGKCGLMGSYEQMGPAGLKESAAFWEQARRSIDNAEKLGGVRLGKRERLCAVALAKRFAVPALLSEELGLPDGKRFPDTATVAAAVWLQVAGIDPQQVRSSQRAWSGQWLHWRRRDQDKDEEPAPEEFWKSLKAAKKKHGAPPAYYAVLAMDADQMGKWLRGENAPAIRESYHPKMIEYFSGLPNGSELLNARRPVGPAMHAAISEALTNFAVHVVPHIVAKHQGTLIYAGGDDVLALLPARCAPACAHELYLAFRGDPSVNNGAPEGFYRHGDRELLMMGPKATLSAGVAVVHYKEDLRLALEAAGRAEKRAKESGRNAWQIEIMRRSGDHSALLCLWPDVQDCVELMRAFDKGASDRWTYRLRALAPTLSALPQEAVQAEIKRQVNRGEEESRRLLGEDKERSAGEIMAEKYAGFMKRREKRETHGLAEFVTFCQSAGFLVRGRDR